MMSALLSRCLILVLGTLYPAYRSYKAIKNKDLREHVKWMMYWIVFALFTTLETFLDIFFSWFPFYYEIKILFILWVLSPATRGSSLLYKKVVHPMLISREKEIDELIAKAKQQGYSTFLQLFTSGFHYASNLFVNSAIRGQSLLGNQLKKSLSLNDVYENSTDKSSINYPVHPNDNYFNHKMPDTINEDEEDSDYENERIRRMAHKSHEPNLRHSKKSNTIAGNLNSNSKGSSSSGYELIDDDILLAEGHLEPAAATTTTTKRQPSGTSATNSRRRASSKQLNSHHNATSTASYKSNEASHFGTITRSKVSRSRVLTSANSLPSQQTIDDNDDS